MTNLEERLRCELALLAESAVPDAWVAATQLMSSGRKGRNRTRRLIALGTAFAIAGFGALGYLASQRSVFPRPVPVDSVTISPSPTFSSQPKPVATPAPVAWTSVEPGADLLETLVVHVDTGSGPHAIATIDNAAVSILGFSADHRSLTIAKGQDLMSVQTIGLTVDGRTTGPAKDVMPGQYFASGSPFAVPKGNEFAGTLSGSDGASNLVRIGLDGTVLSRTRLMTHDVLLAVTDLGGVIGRGTVSGQTEIRTVAWQGQLGPVLYSVPKLGADPNWQQLSRLRLIASNLVDSSQSRLALPIAAAVAPTPYGSKSRVLVIGLQSGGVTDTGFTESVGSLWWDGGGGGPSVLRVHVFGTGATRSNPAAGTSYRWAAGSSVFAADPENDDLVQSSLAKDGTQSLAIRWSESTKSLVGSLVIGNSQATVFTDHSPLRVGSYAVG